MDHLEEAQGDDGGAASPSTRLRGIPSRSSKNAAIAAAMLAQSLENDDNSEETSSRASSRIVKMVGSRARGDSVASSSNSQGLDYSSDEDAQNPDLKNPAHNDDPTIKVSLTRSRSIKARSRRGSSPPPRPSRSRKRPPIRSNTTTGTSFITMRDNSDSENTIPASSVPPSALSANLPSHLPQLSAKENTRVEALLLSSTLSSPAALEMTSSSSSSSYFPGTTSGTTLSDVDTALDTPPLPLHEEVVDYEATMRIPRRFLSQPGAVPGAANRDSEYSAISENEIWQRQHEEDQDGISARYNAHRNSTKSGMFDLELELDASTRTSQIRDDSGALEVQEGDSMDLMPPPSPGCGLGITSDDAIHPEHPYAPVVARAPISPAPGSAPQQANNPPAYSDTSLEYTRQSGYFGQQPTSANITSAGGYISGTASPQSFIGSASSPFNEGSPASSINVHGGHTPGLEGVLPSNGTSSSKWSTSSNYVRRNTGGSIRGNGLYKTPSQQSLRDGNTTGVTPQAQLPAQIVQEGRETPQAGPSISRKDSQNATSWRPASRTNSFNNHHHKASPTGVGIAGIDTVLPEQHSISSPFSPSGTSASSTSFARLQKGRTTTRSRGPSLTTYSNSSSSPYAPDSHRNGQAEGDARFSYAESATSRRTTDSFISTTSTNDNDAADSRRSSIVSTAGAKGAGNLYELESELEEILLSNGQMGTFSSLSPTTSSPPAPAAANHHGASSLSSTARIGHQQQVSSDQPRGPGLMGFETSNGGEDRISKEIEGQAVHLAESGRGKIVQLAKGQLIDNLLVPSGTTHLILSGCTQVRELDLMLRSTLPSLVSSLLVLDISSCALQELPDIISILSHLEELNISFNPLKSGTLPSFLIYNKALRVLLADNCELTNLSPRGRSASIALLNNLHTLSIRGNYLRCLPSWLQSLEENLEILLIDGNPFYGAYADLAKPLLARPATLPLTASSGTSSTTPAPAFSKHEVPAQDKSPSLAELYSDSRDSIIDEPSFPSTTSGGALSPWNELSPSSDRSSFMSRRAKSFRTGLRKASGKALSNNNEDSDTSNNSSRVNSLLLADIDGKASSNASKRASILRPMRSTGELTAPQPSIQSLIEASAMHSSSQASSNAFYTRSMFSSSSTDTEGDLSLPPPTPKKRTRKGSRAQMTVSEFFRFGDHGLPSPPVPSPKDIFHALAHDNPSMSEFENAVDLESAAEDEGGDTLKQQRGRKPSFFKKFSSNAAEKLSKLQRKPSTPALQKVRKQSPRVLDDLAHEEGEEGGAGIEDRMSQVTLGNGKPPRAPFLSEDNRSASDPLAAKSSSTRLPSLPPSRSESPKQSMRASRGSGKPRAPKLSKPPPTAPRSGSLSKSGNLAAGQRQTEKRRSYLLLNATLPPMISPGPLQVSFSRSSHEETQVTFSTEDQTITIPRKSARQDNSATPVPSPFVLDNLSIEERKAALRPLMAYLRDLDELSQEAELYHDNEYTSSVPPSAAVSRAVSRKPSLAAVSSVSASSNRIDSSSGYDSTALTSPNSYHSPSKLKDNPVKRERVIQEILSSEKSYLTGLQDLVTLYIEPASAPYRSSSSVTAVRETIIPQAERKLVFSVAESIEQFHAAVFLPALEHATAQLFTERKSVTSLDQSILAQAVNSIAEVFLRHAAYLKLYHSYCLNFDTAMNRFALWKSIGSGGSMTPVSGAQLPASDSKGTLAGLSTSQRKRIRHVLKSAKRDPRHLQIDLQSYLLLPIQRIPRYKLLLESLVECTPSPHDPSQSHPALSAALETLAQLASEMNEKKRESEGRHRLLHWQERLGASFKSPLVQPHRMLLKEGFINLTRVVKRKSDIIPNTLDPTQEKASALQVHSLVIDNTMKRMAYILCNDVLVLGHLLGDPLSGPVELWTCLRLGRAIGGSEDPASIFGSATMLRIVDARAILYLTCPDHAKALELVNLINQQSRQANHGVV